MRFVVVRIGFVILIRLGSALMVPLLGVVFGMQALDGFFAGCAHESGMCRLALRV